MLRNSDGIEVLPEWALDFLPSKNGCRYKIARGGRGSGKSWAFARMLVIRSCFPKARPIRALCARELQNSIQDSVHQLIVDQIDAMGLLGAFTVRESKITSCSGSEIMFKGLRGMKNNAQALKSLEGVDICWIEEGQTVSEASMQTLAPTIRKQDAEIWITYNPDQASDPVDKLAMNPPKGSIVKTVNWDSNPWFESTSLNIEREWMQRTDPDAYAHVWEGAYQKNSKAQIFSGKYRVEHFTTPDDVERFYFGADWGFAQDPTALIRCYIVDRKLYIDHEAYGISVELDDLPKLFESISEAQAWPIKADSSRPETISHMQRRGWNITPARKWSGSVEDGIAYLRSFEEIVINPRCKHTIEEMRLYKYKVDSLSGDVLPIIVDKHNHCIDALRYSLDGYIKPSYQGPLSMSVPHL